MLTTKQLGNLFDATRPHLSRYPLVDKDRRQIANAWVIRNERWRYSHALEHHQRLGLVVGQDREQRRRIALGIDLDDPVDAIALHAQHLVPITTLQRRQLDQGVRRENPAFVEEGECVDTGIVMATAVL